MKNRIYRALIVTLAIVSLGAVIRSPRGPSAAGDDSYSGLVSLFKEFRDFLEPRIVSDIPDYGPAAMADQKARLPEFQRRLEAVDTRGWPIDRLVDRELVRAEMNGLEFDHRVLRPWSRVPTFYSVLQTSGPDVPLREGPEIHGVLCLADFKLPLDGPGKVVFQSKLSAIPAILARAKANLTERTHDLWILGVRQKKNEKADLVKLSARLAGMHPDLVPLVDRAVGAVDDFRAWLEKTTPAERVPAGVGIGEYDWYMKHVHLVPYTWKEQISLVQRELDRSLAFLELEKHRNKDLPPLRPAASRQELQSRLKESVAYFMNFLRTRGIFTVPDGMGLGDTVNEFVPAGLRDFFVRVDYLDNLPLLCHSMHWLEKWREKGNTRSIRGVPLLYNIWDSRAEGFATEFEELMLQAGLFDRNPRGRELVYLMLAFRCVRAMADLKLHSGDFNVDQAVRYAVETMPDGWVLPQGDTIWGDMSIYLPQPGYGASYVVGKVQMEKLMSDYAGRKKGNFRLRDYLDDLFTKGLIPESLVRWEMTGLDDEIRKLQR